MNARFLPRTPVDLLLAAFVVWFGSDASDFMFSAHGVKPLYSYAAVIGFGAFYAVAQGAAGQPPAILRDRGTRRFVIWLLLYVVYGVLIFLESSQSQVALQALITLIEMVAIGMAFASLMVHRRRLHMLGGVFLLLALFATGMNLLDFFHPRFSNVPGRAAGLYVNPNVAGYALALLMRCGMDSVSARLRWLFVLVCGVGVLVTFSRSAWIMWGVTLVWLGWRDRAHGAKWKFALMTLSTLAGIGILLALFTGELGEWLSGTSFARYLDPNTLARMGVGGSSLSGDSAATRTDLIWFSLQQAAQRPLFGHGSGHVYEWGFPVGPHNMYLRFLVEGGVCGLAFYLALLVVLWRATSGLQRMLVLQLVIASFFSHNLLESPAVILVITFVLAQQVLQKRELAVARWLAPARVGVPA
ncbi:MAG: O-antigen ligase family protein [Rhodanobacter sp.]